MMGKPTRGEGRLYYTGFCLDDRVPADHPLRRVAATVDFSFVRREVAHLYGYNGNPSVDPTLLLKLLFLVFYYNVRSERELMRTLPLRLDWLWFCGLDLDSEIPDHSVLSKARQRWGVELFSTLFAHVLSLCVDAGLVEGRTVHADSTLLKANASKDSRVPRKLWEQLEHGLPPDDADEKPPAGGEPVGQRSEELRPLAQPGIQPARAEKLNQKLVSTTDPDAATHTRAAVGTVLGYREHRLVDDRAGVILATHVTPADGDDGAQLPVLLEQMQQRLGTLPREAVGDSMYGTRSNYELCAGLGIKGYLKKRRGKDSPKVSWLELLPEGCTPTRALELMGRRRTRSEGSFAEAHERHGHRRCRWRRKWRVQLGCLLMAAVQNIKKLIKAGRTRPAHSTAERPGAAIAGLAALIMTGSIRRHVHVPFLLIV
jgi:transposase